MEKEKKDKSEKKEKKIKKDKIAKVDKKSKKEVRKLTSLTCSVTNRAKYFITTRTFVLFKNMEPWVQHGITILLKTGYCFTEERRFMLCGFDTPD